ncbi:zinc-ribbon domain-containing protein [Minwuia thermotolerans]|nr:zinc-ribbon domain-containing protein [Minwuia thermotolerans]
MLTCPSCGARFRVKPEMFAAGPRLVRCARCRHEWRGRPDPDSEAEDAASAAPVAVDEAPEEDAAAESLPPAEADAAAEDAAAEDDGEDAGDDGTADDPGSAETEPEPTPGRREPVFDTIPGAARPADDDFRPAERTEKRRTPAWVWGGWALILAVLVFTALALAFLRGPIVNAWPPSARLFDRIDRVSRAEALQPVSLVIESSRLTGEQMELGIRLINGTAQPQPLPVAVIHLLDAAGDVVKTERIRLDDDPLAPKESRTMRLLLEDLPDGLQKVRADTEPAE